MRTFLTLWRRELAATFLSPIAYVVAIFFLLVTGFNFYLLVDLMSSERVTIAQVMAELFGSVLFFWPVFLVLVPVLTMRVFAEEKRLGTIETLMTAPVTDRVVVWAKFAGALTCFAILWAPTISYAFILQAFSAEAAPLDFAPMLGGYFGTFLAGMFYLSVGVFCSAMCRNQIVSAIACFALMCLAFYGGFLHYFAANETVRDISKHISTVVHQLDFARGLIDTRPLVYYLSGTALMLFLTIRLVETKRF